MVHDELGRSRVTDRTVVYALDCGHTWATRLRSGADDPPIIRDIVTGRDERNVIDMAAVSRVLSVGDAVYCLACAERKPLGVAFREAQAITEAHARGGR